MGYRALLDDVPTSTSLNQLSHFGERLYWRLLSQTDSYGRLPGELVKLRDLCVPRLAVSDNELADTLEELVRAGRIALYCVDGTWVCQLLDFDTHQPVANLKRGRSRWPARPETSAESPCKIVDPPDRQTETEETRSLGSSYVPLDADLPIENQESEVKSSGEELLRFGKFDLVELSRTLRGADQRTPMLLAIKLRGMPEAALASAIEALELRRLRAPALQSEARYVVGTLTTMRREGQYA